MSLLKFLVVCLIFVAVLGIAECRKGKGKGKGKGSSREYDYRYDSHEHRGKGKGKGKGKGISADYADYSIYYDSYEYGGKGKGKGKGKGTSSEYVDYYYDSYEYGGKSKGKGKGKGKGKSREYDFDCERLRWEVLDIKSMLGELLGDRDHQSRYKYPTNCVEIQLNGNDDSGVYDIYLGKYGRPTQVYCDLETSSGGWITFLKRTSADLDFKDMVWANYTKGFGHLYEPNFWYGNEIVRRLTKDREQRLRIDLETMNGEKLYLEYTDFWLGSRPTDDEQTKGYELTERYRIHLGEFSGNTNDSLAHIDGNRFGTKDHPIYDTHDEHQLYEAGCDRQMGGGGWWYYQWNCQGARATGPYTDQGIEWKNRWYDPLYLRKVEMKFRPMEF